MSTTTSVDYSTWELEKFYFEVYEPEHLSKWPPKRVTDTKCIHRSAARSLRQQLGRSFTLGEITPDVLAESKAWREAHSRAKSSTANELKVIRRIVRYGIPTAFPHNAKVTIHHRQPERRWEASGPAKRQPVDRRKRPRGFSRVMAAVGVRKWFTGRFDDLPEIVEDYIEANQVCDKHAYRLRNHVDRFCTWSTANRRKAGRGTVSQELNAWLTELQAEFEPATVNGFRQSIVSLLRFATPDGQPLPRTDRIRRIREPEKFNPAYTRDEILAMIDAAPGYQPVTHRTYGRGVAGDTVPRHRPDGVPWSIWWGAFVRAAYESGQYLHDLSVVEWSHVKASGVVTFVRRKTGRANSFRLSAATITACREIGHPSLILPWQFDTASYFAREFHKFAAFAGVRRLGAKAIRRAAITYTFIEQGEEAARSLAGHASFLTTAKHYIDWTLAEKPIVTPPSL